MGDIKVTMDCGFGNLEIDLCYLGKSGLGARLLKCPISYGKIYRNLEKYFDGSKKTILGCIFAQKKVRTNRWFFFLGGGGWGDCAADRNGIKRNKGRCVEDQNCSRRCFTSHGCCCTFTKNKKKKHGESNVFFVPQDNLAWRWQVAPQSYKKKEKGV